MSAKRAKVTGIYPQDATLTRADGSAVMVGDMVSEGERVTLYTGGAPSGCVAIDGASPFALHASESTALRAARSPEVETEFVGAPRAEEKTFALPASDGTGATMSIGFGARGPLLPSEAKRRNITVTTAEFGAIPPAPKER